MTILTRFTLKIVMIRNNKSKEKMKNIVTSFVPKDSKQFLIIWYMNMVTMMILMMIYSSLTKKQERLYSKVLLVLQSLIEFQQNFGNIFSVNHYAAKYFLSVWLGRIRQS